MSVNDINSLLSSVSWTEEALYLKEFIHKNGLPRVCKVVKGQYLNLGVPSLSSPGSQNHLLLVNLGKCKRILAQSVKFKENQRKIAAVGQKFAIPSSFEGYFEILNEDGKAVKCIESVHELCRRFPDSALVRESMTAFVSKSDDAETIRERSRTIKAGETLILVGEVTSTSIGNNNSNNNNKSSMVSGSSSSNSSSNSSSSTSSTHQQCINKYLRCFDSQGENVYLPFDLKGVKFSAIAKEENISGVHTAENLMNKRLPMMARLVDGQPPFGLKTPSNFVPDMRLLAVLEEDYVVAMVLSPPSGSSSSSKSSSITSPYQVVPVPSSAFLKVQTAKNASVIEDSKAFGALLNRCRELAATHLQNRIVIHDIAFNRDLRLNGPLNHKHNPSESKGSDHHYQSGILQQNNVTILQAKRKNRRSNMIPLSGSAHQLYFPTNTEANGADSQRVSPAKSSGDSMGSGLNGGDDYDEIEQIYDYVRGFAPLPKSARGWKYDIPPPQPQPPERGSKSPSSMPPQKTEKENLQTPPEPPPIETIPSRNQQNHSLPVSSSTHNLHQLHSYGASPPLTPEDPYGYYQTAGGPPLSHHAYNIYEGLETTNGTLRRLREESSSQQQIVVQQPQVQVHPAQTRFIKSATTHRSANANGKHKFFRQRQHTTINKVEPPPQPSQPAPGSSLTFGRTGGLYGHLAKPSFFHLRYKSLTNLAGFGNVQATGHHHQSIQVHHPPQPRPDYYDTLESSNSGGKTNSGDSGGSRTLPEKRIRTGKLGRPKSLTNLFGLTSVKNSEKNRDDPNVNGRDSGYSSNPNKSLYHHPSYVMTAGRYNSAAMNGSLTSNASSSANGQVPMYSSATLGRVSSAGNGHYRSQHHGQHQHPTNLIHHGKKLGSRDNNSGESAKAKRLGTLYL